jgi:hypothetical protein
MKHSHPCSFRWLFLALLILVSARVAQAQDERTTSLESAVAKLSQLKISGYIQPQWQWGDVDSLGNQVNTRNFFTMRRGRIKFQHTTKVGDGGSVNFSLMQDITEAGVTLKEVYASWNPIPEFQVALGAMNRPFGYEIGYSSASREVTEYSLAETRLFNAETDLGIQFAITPTLGSLKPVLEFGLFNGSDNFAKGPISFNPSTNAAFFPINAAIGTPAASDALLFAPQSGNTAIKQNAKELLGHLRIPFSVSDDFSFGLGASWSVGGVTEPTDLLGEYAGANGILQLHSGGSGPSGSFNGKSGSASNGILQTNRKVFGADAQFYLKLIPAGGTIIRTELYAGQVPFYGTSSLFTHDDSLTLGVARPSTVLKKVLGYYAMLVQNVSDALQLAVRYDVYDPNTNVEGLDFAVHTRGINSTANFGGDLKQSTVAVDVNVLVSSAMRLMLDYDHVTNESYSRFGGTVISDPKDDRFTFRMQYKF